MFPLLPGLSAAIRRVFDDLDQGEAAPAGECVPPLDLYELEEALVVVLDLPGVPAHAVRALVKDGVLVIAGEKPTPPCAAAKEDARFHLAERAFGRFARAIALPGPFDASRADAIVEAGILRVRIPRVGERRGVPIHIHISGT
jgi:HSP20 family protein